MTAKPATKANPETRKPAPKQRGVAVGPVPDHYYEGIEGWFNFAGVYRDQVAAAEGKCTFVEVGCWKGRSAAYLGVEILKSGKPITLHCVDHWCGFKDEQTGEYWMNTAEAEALFQQFRSNMQPCVDAGLDVVVHIGDSAEMANQKFFLDGSLDFVWLDAGHDYESVKRDIEAWLPKVRPGGVLGGDDYPFEGVGKAVDELLAPVELHTENGWTTWTKRVD